MELEKRKVVGHIWVSVQYNRLNRFLVTDERLLNAADLTCPK
jgi:hypothetical protein